MTVFTEAQKRLFKTLDTLDIKYQLHHHPPLFTVEESRQYKQVIAGGHTKNLFLKDKQNRFFLLCALDHTEIRLNQLHKKIASGRLSFAKLEALREILGVQPGSVTLFALMNDQKGNVDLLLDESIFEHELINFHPLINTSTLTLKSEDLPKWIKTTGNAYKILNLKTEE